MIKRQRYKHSSAFPPGRNRDKKLNGTKNGGVKTLAGDSALYYLCSSSFADERSRRSSFRSCDVRTAAIHRRSYIGASISCQPLMQRAPYLTPHATPARVDVWRYPSGF
ncbi:hypothetical protein EVAR_60578_1 [Eumeta japonica]|uniref:Uncharacterized protein n=1 Tax=Eumeta variegata TaxID=151549 RepID=A0A4C1YEG9_EUMVA|nr:hypothetical protein EVAR_60578_1 [Eumeta japonica]